ncbi:MAG: phosphoenolpyruvate--protein phosphotransferase [Candidatus Adiutrix sp.]|nr:phosphoenolpyruvate--protein phosphotransferase [Candidatus Adiutrix sp.]
MTSDVSRPDRLKLMAPLSGLMLPLAEVPDPTFARKMVGDGVSIDPASEVLLSPVDGRVTLLHKARHALTVSTDEGLEVLMHIGLETVGLKGEGFSPKVAEGDRVTVGDPLIAFDAALLARRAASLLTQIVIANGEKVAAYYPAEGRVEAGRSVVLELELAGAEAAGDRAESGQSRETEEIVILNPEGLHARPTAVLSNSAKRYRADVRLIKGARAANAKSVVSVMGLDVKRHDRVRVRAVGPDAAEAVEHLAALIKAGLGESLHGAPRDPAPPARPPRAEPAGDPNILRGVAASPGLVTGRIFQLRQSEIKIEEKGRGEAAEREALIQALAASKKELKELQNQLRLSADVGKAAIFAAHQEILEDPELLSQTYDGLKKGQSAALAWRTAYLAQAETLKNLKNELLAGRANDLRDVGRRVLGHLSGQRSGPAAIPEESILIAEDLTPSDIASLDKRRVAGFCTTGGGATSHVAILARSAGLPAIAAIEARVLEIPDGLPAVLDGGRAELRLSPSVEEMAAIKVARNEAARARARELAVAAEPAVTRDGRRLKVAANISGLAEAEESVGLGGEGVGLLRSEFLFLGRTEAPDEAEQASVYTAVAKALGPERDLVVRTLDVGGDKPLAYLPLPPEVNPFLGVRGIRLNLLGPELLTAQVRAILSAAPFSHLCIMFPMVSAIEEVREAKAIVAEQKQALGIRAGVQVGIMVEVPSAAVLAQGLAAEVDFFSIGTNDLTQYTLAIDRGHPRLAKMADGLHPAVLTLINQTVQGAHRHGKWVGVCGGLAGEPAAIPILLGLGVDELSVSVSALPAVKAAVRRLRLSDCRELAAEALTLLSAAEVRSRVNAFLADHK